MNISWQWWCDGFTLIYLDLDRLLPWLLDLLRDFERDLRACLRWNGMLLKRSKHVSLINLCCFIILVTINNSNNNWPYWYRDYNIVWLKIYITMHVVVENQFFTIFKKFCSISFKISRKSYRNVFVVVSESWEMAVWIFVNY